MEETECHTIGIEKKHKYVDDLHVVCKYKKDGSFHQIILDRDQKRKLEEIIFSKDMNVSDEETNGLYFEDFVWE